MNEQELIRKINSLEIKVDLLLKIIQDSNFANAVNSVSSCQYTLYSWLEEWYNTYKAPKLKVGSLKAIKIAIDKHIKSNIIDCSLNILNGLDIQKAINCVKASRTKKEVYNVFSGALRQAYKLHIIIDNPMVSIDPVKHKKKHGKALTIEEQQYFLQIIENHKLKNLYLFYLYTGCRRSEALNITWCDVDLKNKMLHISGTKTDSSDRRIPLFDNVCKILKGLPKDTSVIFPYTAEGIKSSFARLKKHYNLSYRLHDLRHTFATRCIEIGISLKTIQKWLGHSKLDTTANIYTHVQSKFELEEADKVNAKTDPF